MADELRFNTHKGSHKMNSRITDLEGSDVTSATGDRLAEVNPYHARIGGRVLLVVARGDTLAGAVARRWLKRWDAVLAFSHTIDRAD